MIKLNNHCSDIWTKVGRDFSKEIRELSNRVWSKTILPDISVVHFLVESAYRVMKGPYYEDMKAIAKETSLPVAKVILTNLLYDVYMHQRKTGFLKAMVGCVAVALKEPDGHIRMFRSFEWPDKEVSVKPVFIKELDHDITIDAICIPGMVGFFTGIKFDQYTISLNSAPATSGPYFLGVSPPMLVRMVLEACGTFGEATAMLREAQVSSPSIFMVTSKADACVIEKTTTSYEASYIDKELIRTNHFVSLKTKNSKHIKESLVREAIIKASIKNKEPVDYLHEQLGKCNDDMLYALDMCPTQIRIL